ncbi:MAG: trypsin-like serine peptidase [Methylobacter sp.]
MPVEGGGRLFAAIRGLAAALFVIAGLTGARAQPATGIIGEDDRELLDPQAWPWLAIGRVNRTSGGFCTGTLVAPDLVLTAQHCLVNHHTGRRVAPDTVHFLAGYRRGEWLSHGVGRAFLLPDSSANGPPALADDWVLVILEKALNVTPIPVIAISQGQAAGARLARAGYARNRPHLLSLHERCAILGRGDNVLVHDCDATYGDSGSPLLMDSDGDPFIVGMTTGTTKLQGKDVGIAIDARAFVDRLKRPADATGK